MTNQILDDRFQHGSIITSKEDVKRVLRENGIQKFYEHRKGHILIEEGDAIRVAVTYNDGVVSAKPKFPAIGSSVQWLTTVILLFTFLFIIPSVIPFPWVVAILGGQFITYRYYLPRTRKLAERVERMM